jgi:serine/threonine protein kinase
MTQTGNTIGTFQYIAPERLGTGAVEDGRVDIYSLACVLYECLAGDPPFDGDTMGLDGRDQRCDGTARVGPGRRQPPPNPRALNRFDSYSVAALPPFSYPSLVQR